jgi:hypothetical protein
MTVLCGFISFQGKGELKSWHLPVSVVQILPPQQWFHNLFANFLTIQKLAVTISKDQHSQNNIK